MINAELKFYDWNEILGEDTTEDAWKKFKDILHKAREKHVPVITAKKSKVAPRQWITKATRRSMSRKKCGLEKVQRIENRSKLHKV